MKHLHTFEEFLNESNKSVEMADAKIDKLPAGKLFDDAKNIEKVFKKSKYSWNDVIVTYEQYEEQHHIKITMMEQVLKDLVSKQELSKNDVSKNAQVSAPAMAANRQMTEQPTPSQLNINELSDLIMSRMEAQLDLKAFYDNDEKLMNEIEELKSVVQSQQMVINSLNSAVFSLISKLNVSVPMNVSSDDMNSDADAANDANADANAELDGVFNSEVDMNSSQDLNTDNVREGLTPTFPKSVMINETNNTVQEFKNDFDVVNDVSYDNSNITY